MPVAVGIIANPASGKDIRRLVAHGSVFDNQEKINIIRRILTALDAMGIHTVWVMPDYAGLAFRATRDLGLGLEVSLLDMEAVGRQDDSTKAAALLRDMDVGVVITLGGDGTNRVAAKTLGNVPLLPVSTGTNNVFPYMVEGTVAGLAAGAAASDRVDLDSICFRAPRLDICRNGDMVDLALIDLVVTDMQYTGVRAVWDADAVKEIFLTQCRPSSIGFSSIGGYVHPLDRDSGRGLHLLIGPGGTTIKAPIAPGMIASIPVAEHKTFAPGEGVAITPRTGIIALDGERELTIKADDKWTVRFNPMGPRVIDIDRALEQACACRLFDEC